jgi:hypothetical protein
MTIQTLAASLSVAVLMFAPVTFNAFNFTGLFH